MKGKEDYQMQRAEFLNPEVDVIEFEAEDVITSSNETSGGLINGGMLPEGGGDNIDVDDLFP